MLTRALIALSLVGAVACPALGAQGRKLVRRVRTAERLVSLTFDACATQRFAYGFDRPLFEVLQRDRIPATIFVSGRWVETHPDEARELAGEPLLEFGNHSYDHKHLVQLTRRRIAEEIRQADEVLERVVGRRSVAFRPPFGEWDRRTLRASERLGLPVVLWDIASGDPAKWSTPERILRKVLPRVRAGSVLIFHINGRGHGTAAALPELARSLRERGFRLVKLSELLGVTEPKPVEAGAATVIGTAARSPAAGKSAAPGASAPAAKTATTIASPGGTN